MSRPMHRRSFLTLVGTSAAVWPLTARAQQALPRVGYLSARRADFDLPLLTAFRRGLSEVGYAEGRNVVIETRFAEDQIDRLSVLAQDLVRLGVSVLVTVGGTPPLQAARAATTVIPIIFA